MNFTLKTCDPSVLKTVVAMMYDLGPWGYFSATKDGVKLTCEDSDYGIIGMKFEIKPEKISMFVCTKDTKVVFLTNNILNYLKKVSRTDTLKLSDKQRELELYSVSQKKL